MSVPLIQQWRVGSYIMAQRLKGRARYPLVLMLEPLFRCNLACPGCGKIDYPDEILNKRLTVKECLDAVDACGAPIVSIPGGEPLLHKDIEEIVEGIIERKKFVYLCTNALLLEKRIDRFKPTPYLTFSVHLDGMKEEHDRAVGQDGVFERAVSAIRLARSKGFRTNINCTLYEGHDVGKLADFISYACSDLGVEGVTVSPGFPYEAAPSQDKFLKRERTRRLFRELFLLGKGRNWRFSQSTLFLDFLAGNQDYACTPWGTPTRNVFGWQKPCYLLSDGHANSFKELMETTDWERYGEGKDPRCADCMMHCGYEATAVADTVAHPLKALKVFLRGPGLTST
ncbi:MAG: adenosyl-hopene transferase HpnH [Alphaproteobacteria bacterium]|nr:adenosyl-hopene transferase HpnH [Alphaproteobacteria bacterium]